MAGKSIDVADKVSAEDARLAAFLATTTQAQAARLMGQPGKAFRDITRSVFGVYVSRDDGGAWDERVKRFRYAYATTSGDARKAVVAAYKVGDEVPPSTE